MKYNNSKYTNTIIVILTIVLFIIVYNIVTTFKTCEGLNDGSYCMPNTKTKFYLKTKLGKKVFLDLTKSTIYLDSMQQTGFYVKGCLKNIFDTTYLRYNPSQKDFTDSYTLIKVGSKDMSISTVKNLKDGNENILFIKRVNSEIKSGYNLVRLGIRHNKKYYWFNETQEGDWLWTTDLKNASSFDIVYYE